jgi:methylmalonyl-CoA/ethylmalonyl-CoA epimerase
VRVSGLHHIGYVVPRMGPALSRFVDEGATVVVEPIDDPVQRVTVALLRADGDVPIELVAPTPGLDSPVVARLRRGGGFDHLCYSVADVGDALAQEASRGGLIVCSPVFAVAFTRTVGFVQRRSGMVIEYISDEEAQAG